MAGYSKIINFIKDLYGNQEFHPLPFQSSLVTRRSISKSVLTPLSCRQWASLLIVLRDDMARYTGCKRAVVCVSGTNALHMALMLSGVERDDEVLTQALTFIATCNALSYIGAHPVFIDVDKSTMGLSPDAIKKWFAKNARDSQWPVLQQEHWSQSEGLCTYALSDILSA